MQLWLIVMYLVHKYVGFAVVTFAVSFRLLFIIIMNTIDVLVTLHLSLTLAPAVSFDITTNVALRVGVAAAAAAAAFSEGVLDL